MRFRETLNKSFDELRTNGKCLISFVVSLSNHTVNQLVQCFLRSSRQLSRFGALLPAIALCTACPAQSDAQRPLQIGRHAFLVDVAATPAQREHGLKGRTRLPANGGMLFVFEHAGRPCFWMRDTPLPLSIAFIDVTGRIAHLDDMQPNTDTLHCPAVDVRYALELAQGGFQQRSIVPGTLVAGLPRQR